MGKEEEKSQRDSMPLPLERENWLPVDFNVFPPKNAVSRRNAKDPAESSHALFDAEAVRKKVEQGPGPGESAIDFFLNNPEFRLFRPGDPTDSASRARLAIERFNGISEIVSEVGMDQIRRTTERQMESILDDIRSAEQELREIQSAQTRQSKRPWRRLGK